MSRLAPYLPVGTPLLLVDEASGEGHRIMVNSTPDALAMRIGRAVGKGERCLRPSRVEKVCSFTESEIKVRFWSGLEPAEAASAVAAVIHRWVEKLEARL